MCLFPGVYFDVSGAMLVFGGVNWFLPLEDEGGLDIFFPFSKDSC